jgi:hypothetical protein
MTTVHGPRGIEYFQLIATRGALKLELHGIRAARGYSAYAVVKQRFGFKGNKQRVYDQFDAHIKQFEKDHEAELKDQITIN